MNTFPKLDLSIIIISYNTRKLLECCLTSIYDTFKNRNFEVIVIDNSSTDGSVEMIQKFSPLVKLVKNSQNLGFSKANNQGARLARGEFLLFLNSDTEALPGALAKLFDFSRQQNPLGISGAKLLNTNKTPQPSCGWFYTLPIIILSLFFKGDQLQLTRCSPNVIKSVDWISGACLLLAAENFRKLGGFDERIFMYMDEVDLCYRAKKKDMPVVFYPLARFLHVGSASSSDRRTPVVNLFRGLLYFYHKHRPQYLGAVKLLLSLKAVIAVSVGFLLADQSLSNSYRKALEIVNKYG